MQLNDLRTDYGKYTLDEKALPKEPAALFQNWMQAAVKAALPDANAMVLSTIDTDGFPASRIVLLREFSTDTYIYYTNYKSAKGQQLAINPRTCLLFYWPSLERQIRILGTSKPVSTDTSDAYFATRPYESQIGAWASAQSSPLQSQEALQEAVNKLKAQFPSEVPRPPHWGGYALTAKSYEFWQGRPSRLHDRIMYNQTNTLWTKQRLAP